MSIQCSGAFIYSLDTNRFLFLHRSSGKKSDLWGLVGGTNENNETPWEGLQREIYEEIGCIDIKKTIPLEVFTSHDCFFSYYTYFCIVKNEFIPKLIMNMMDMRGYHIKNGLIHYTKVYTIPYTTK